MQVPTLCRCCHRPLTPSFYHGNCEVYDQADSRPSWDIFHEEDRDREAVRNNRVDCYQD